MASGGGDQPEWEGWGNPATQKLTELLNCAGRKLLELKACLHQEAIEANEAFDVSTYMPLINRFQNEIGTVDSIQMCKTTSENSLHTLISNKKKYHYYLEELKNVSFISTKPVFEGKNCSFHDASESLQEEFADTVTGSMNTDCENGTSNLEYEKNIATQKHANMTPTDPDDMQLPKISNAREMIEESFSSHMQKQEVGGYQCSLEDVDNTDGPTDKYAVVRKKSRQRMRLCDDHFSASYTPKLKSPISCNNLTIFSPRMNSKSICNEEGSKKVSLSPDSKKAGESWFECRERSLLQNRFSRSEPRVITSSFTLKDTECMKKRPPTVTSPKKSVRFSLSPATRRTTGSLNGSITKYGSDTSDDEVGFAVVQFPLIDERK